MPVVMLQIYLVTANYWLGTHCKSFEFQDQKSSCNLCTLTPLIKYFCSALQMLKLIIRKGYQVILSSTPAHSYYHHHTLQHTAHGVCALQSSSWCQLLDDMIRDLFESATANGQELMTTPQQNRPPGRDADQSGQCGSHQLSIQ